MKRLITSTLITTLIAFASIAEAKEKDPIRVSDVTFDQTSSGWITADVEFEAGDFAADSDARKKDYLNRVKLTLTVAYEDRDLTRAKDASTDEKENPYEFYQRTVELAAVKRSSDITLRFFIPPAIVESKSFPDKPIAWMLEWEVEGLKMPVDVTRFPKHFSKSLQKEAAFTKFTNSMSEGAKANEGIMLPQYYGPGGLQPRRDSKDFAFVRKDGV